MRLTTMARKHHEAVKFLLVGGVCFVATTVINYALKLSALHQKPVTALAVATIVSTVLSYVLNREWSFRSRGGRERHHEAALFFAVSAVGVALNLVPLAVSRYVFMLRVPDVSRPVQEIADFVSGIVLGTLVAMCFRLWAFKRFVFPEAEARPQGLGRPRRAGRHGSPVKNGPRTSVVHHKLAEFSAGPGHGHEPDPQPGYVARRPTP